MNLLITTAGTSDVQLVQNGRRCKLDGSIVGTLLDEIAQRTWEPVNSPREMGDRISRLPEGKLLICVPKVEDLLEHFRPSPERPSLSVLILETCRNMPSDPRRAGEFMEKVFHTHGVHNVKRVAYLVGDERLEGPASSSVIRPEVVRRIEKAIVEAIECTKRERGCVYVAATGGIPAVAELVTEIARFYCSFGPPMFMFSIEVPEHGKATFAPYDPAEVFRTRRHTVTLISAILDITLPSDVAKALKDTLYEKMTLREIT